MPANAEAHSKDVPTNRNCTTEITNVTADYILIKPKIFMKSGFPHSPPQPTLSPGKTEVCSFIKDDNTASGAVGVMTYELFNTQNRSSNQQIAIMFSVPFDYGLFENRLAVGIIDKATKCDEKLYKSMYENEGKEGEEGKDEFVRYKANGSGLTFHGTSLDVRATMNDDNQGIVKLELYDRLA